MRRQVQFAFEAEVSQCLFGIQLPKPPPTDIDNALRDILTKCGVTDAKAIETFVSQGIITLEDAKAVFQQIAPQPAALKLNVMQWTRLCQMLNPPHA
jgi:hypothetical protein